MINSFKSDMPYVDNLEEIESNGIKVNAILINIESVNNVTINGENPQILTYEFESNREKEKSKFCVFDPNKTNELKKGDTIAIKHLNGMSIPTEFEQYSIGFNFIYYIALVFLLFGILFCYLLFSRIKEEITLYRTGIIKEGKIISISQNKGFLFSKFGMSMDVHYEYKNNISKSRTDNFALTSNKSVGETIKILVSQDGIKSCLYPELIAQTNGWNENYIA